MYRWILEGCAGTCEPFDQEALVSAIAEILCVPSTMSTALTEDLGRFRLPEGLFWIRTDESCGEIVSMIMTRAEACEKISEIIALNADLLREQ